MQKQATFLALLAILFALFISTPSVQAAADDKEAYGTGKVFFKREKKGWRKEELFFYLRVIFYL